MMIINLWISLASSISISNSQQHIQSYQLKPYVEVQTFTFGQNVINSADKSYTVTIVYSYFSVMKCIKFIADFSLAKNRLILEGKRPVII